MRCPVISTTGGNLKPKGFQHNKVSPYSCPDPGGGIEMTALVITGKDFYRASSSCILVNAKMLSP